MAEHTLQSIAFPTLDDAQVSEFERCTNATKKLYRDGQTLISSGRRQLRRQAAAFLAQHASKVFLLIRGDDLYKNMSSYLVHRIEQTANIELLTNTTIRRMSGDGHLAAVEIVNQKTGLERTVVDDHQKERNSG